MINILTATTCRTRNFPKQLFDRKRSGKCYRVDRTDTLSNPLYLETVERNLKCVINKHNIFYEDLQFQHPPNIRGNYWYVDKKPQIEKQYSKDDVVCDQPDAYDLCVIEVCSPKFGKHDKKSLNFDQFETHIKTIENICNCPVLWISAHNISFTAEHKNKLNIPHDKFTKNNQLKTRCIVDEYMSEIVSPNLLVMPSQVFANYTSQNIFVCDQDWWSGTWAGQEGGGNTHHYTPRAMNLIGKEISNKIGKLFNYD